MADSEAFEFVCEKLEEGTDLERLEARGTVRIALKEAGLEARSVTPAELAVVVTRILPGELHARSVQNPDDLCMGIASGLSMMGDGVNVESPYTVFERLGKS